MNPAIQAPPPWLWVPDTPQCIVPLLPRPLFARNICVESLQISRLLAWRQRLMMSKCKNGTEMVIVASFRHSLSYHSSELSASLSLDGHPSVASSIGMDNTARWIRVWGRLEREKHMPNSKESPHRQKPACCAALLKLSICSTDTRTA
jgi:hypothetical protein